MSEPTGSWSVSATDVTRCSRRISARASTASTIEKCWPMQARGPPPNGIHAYRCAGSGRLPVPVNRLGSNTSGSTQRSGRRWMVHGTTTTLLPAGTRWPISSSSWTVSRPMIGAEG